uniref:Uncharacterized protein n=1 Tax=Timema bartmani TaxID=61472 RepID=A0A7R9I118_9NEOP|nr:unnamed protein product [Timema bartmani]
MLTGSELTVTPSLSEGSPPKGSLPQRCSASGWSKQQSVQEAVSHIRVHYQPYESILSGELSLTKQACHLDPVRKLRLIRLAIFIVFTITAPSILWDQRWHIPSTGTIKINLNKEQQCSFKKLYKGWGGVGMAGVAGAAVTAVSVEGVVVGAAVIAADTGAGIYVCLSASQYMNCWMFYLRYCVRVVLCEGVVELEEAGTALAAITAGEVDTVALPV